MRNVIMLLGNVVKTTTNKKVVHTSWFKLITRSSLLSHSPLKTGLAAIHIHGPQKIPPMVPTSNENAESLSWLSSESLQTWLRKKHHDTTLQVISYKVEPATAKGENYLSDLMRLTAQIQNSHDKPQTISLILKCKPKGGYREDFVNTGRFFTKELEMYSRTLPKMSFMLKKLRCDIKLIANFVHHVESPSVFVMEDLTHSGFRLAKKNGLDLAHCKMAMKALGIFHGTSVVINVEKPELLNAFRPQVFCEETQGYMGAYLKSTITALAEEVERWPVYKERYGDKLRKAADRSWEIIMETVKRNDESFNVLNHGDLWLNNIMFHYSETDQVDNIAFVDFQMCCFTSPAIDLHYFFYSSPDSEVRAQHSDTLLSEYHSSLCDTLSSLGYSKKPPTIDQLKEDLKKRLFYGLFTASSSLPNILADPDHGFDLESSLESGENPSSSNKNMYKSKAYRKEIERLLPIFEKNGVL